ncbi:OmpA family protein [Variovorax sp. VNK109]|uniref:OmpA family protein n=1 Tax=Variovorax sp. VNK109 TaxID=3400919 RepID=UPI003C06DE28
MNKQIKWMGATALAVLLLALQGCGTSVVSKDVTDDGRAGEVVFPDIGKDAWLKEGTFPNVTNLRSVAPGMRKDQLYDLLGRPHFREGLGQVREWDYIFHFRTGKGSEYVTCQYKAIFDKDVKAQTFHWLPADCASQLNMATAPVQEKVIERVVERVVERVAPVATTAQVTQLSADALFTFDRSGPADLLPAGRVELDRFATQLRNMPESDRVQVTGHTDRLGDAAYNQQLSESRARTVRQYLIERGVPASRIAAQGKGETEPVVQCAEQPREKLVACLAPNRRVDIDVELHGKR